jgi:hypothetical protein
VGESALVCGEWSSVWGVVYFVKSDPVCGEWSSVWGVV